MPWTPPSPRGWVIDSNSITIRWNAPEDGGSDITSYEIEVRPVEPETDGASIPNSVHDGRPERSEDVMIDKADNTRISNLPGSRTEYTLSGLKAFQGYFFRIRALNDADGDGRRGEHPDDPNAQSGQVAERSDWTLTDFPDVMTLRATLGTHVAPLNIMATKEDDVGQINLRWPPPVVPENETRSPVTRYEIQFVQSDAATYTEAFWADAETLVPVPPTNNVHSHTGLPGSKRFVYRVRAFNSAGASPYTVIPDGATT